MFSPRYPQATNLHRISIFSYPLSVLVKDAQTKLEGISTLKPNVLKRISSSSSTAIWKGIRAIAEFTFWLDEMVGKTADRIFRALPTSWQLALRRANDQFKRARNTALGVEELYNVPREKKTKFDSSSTDSNASSIDSSKSPEHSSIGSSQFRNSLGSQSRSSLPRLADQRGDVPGWVLVVLMTTGLVTALWTIAAPRLSQILRNSLDSMNSIR